MHYWSIIGKFDPNPEPQELKAAYENYKELFGDEITLRDFIELCKADAIECFGEQLSNRLHEIAIKLNSIISTIQKEEET